MKRGLAIALVGVNVVGMLAVLAPTATAYDIATAAWTKVTISTSGGTGESMDGVAATDTTWFTIGCKTNVDPDEVRVFKTTNAGATWSSIVAWTHASLDCDGGNTDPISKWHIGADSENHVVGLVYASNGTFALETQNGGSTWAVKRLVNVKFTASCMDIGAGTDYIGGVYSGQTYRAWRNTGAGWSATNVTVGAGSFGGTICNMASDNDSIAWFYWNNNDGSRHRAMISKSEDQGVTWDVVRAPSGADCSAFGKGPFVVEDSNTVYQFVPKFHDSSGNCGGAPSGCFNALCGQIIKTTNAGGSWSQLQYGGSLVGCGGDDTKGKFVAAGVFLIGCGTSIILTHDGAVTLSKATTQITTPCATMNEGFGLDYVKAKPLIFYGEGSNGAEQGRVCVGGTVDLATLAGVLTGGYFWCSAIGSPKGGYDFLEDVVVQRGDVIGLDLTGDIKADFYRFKGNSGDFAYLGKAFTVEGSPKSGSKAVVVNFTLEAGTDAVSSVFRTAFSSVMPTGTLTSPTLAKGNGKTTGAFAEHVEVELTEVASSWSIRLYYVTGAGDRTQLGPAWEGGSPNRINSFSFIVDSRGADAYVGIQDALGAFLKVGAVEMKFALPSALVEDEWKSQWFIGYGTSVFFEAVTRLSSKISNSTCIRDLVGTIVAGVQNGCLGVGDCGTVVDPDQGTTPGQQLAGTPGVTEPPPLKGGIIGASIPFAAEGGGNLFAVILFIGSFALAGFYLTGGRIYRKGSGGPTVIPGSTPVIMTSAYLGLLFSVKALGVSAAIPMMLAVVALFFLGHKAWHWARH